MVDLVSELQRYGAAKSGIRIFDAPNPRDIRYLDLFTKLNAAPPSQTNGDLPSGVVEYADRPLVYLIRDDVLSLAPDLSTNRLRRLIRSLACRGEGAYLAVVRPGELLIYPVLLSESVLPPMSVEAASPKAPILIQELATTDTADWLQPDKAYAHDQRVRASAIHALLFRLLTGVTEALRNSDALSKDPAHDDVLPLVGRALFTRFLIDRGIINEKTFPAIYHNVKPAECFSTPEFASITCKWLDDKFNGDVLPLADRKYAEFFRRVDMRDNSVLHQLSNIMYRAPDGVLSFDLYWHGIDFAHVPVGLLSEVYEDYAHRFFKDDARLESVRFTPRHIAEFTINHAFQGLKEGSRAQANLLDPAAGAGVFLVLGLQRLVSENWLATGERPDTKKIREILNTQICGFDINNYALTLAALSLYLTALELDPAPYPPEKLRFEKLMDNVLFNMRTRHEKYPYGKSVLGSLGPRGTRDEHLGKFDLVVGNPPWTSWSDDAGRALNVTVNNMVREIIKSRARNDALMRIGQTYEHNDMVPDIAFIWRSAQWAKEDGVIALVLHARILFKRGERGSGMRDAIFRSFRITGILNGSDLMKLWPHLNQPFCILFARNRISQSDDTFWFVTPELDRAVNGTYQMRIDAEAAQPVEMCTLERQPYLLKTLSLGGRLDVELMERLNSLKSPQLIDIDSDDEEVHDNPKPTARATKFSDLWSNKSGLFSGQGYFPGTKRKTTKLLALKGKRLTKEDSVGLVISAAKLEPFTDQTALWPRDPRIYLPPLLLISEGFYEPAEGVRAHLYFGRTPLIYNRSFYGYSTAGHPHGKDLAEYLFVLASSDLFTYYILESSAKLGVERRTALKEDIGDFPVIKFDLLSTAQCNRLRRIVDLLLSGDRNSWAALNRWVYELYQLTTHDVQTVRDTLETRMPFEAAATNALRPATEHEQRTFVENVEAVLNPFFKSTHEEIHGRLLPLPTSTWVVFDLQTRQSKGTDEAITKIALLIAENERASRVMHEVDSGHLRIAIRNQYRYLTKTKARLCAIDILREKGNLFPIQQR